MRYNRDNKRSGEPHEKPQKGNIMMIAIFSTDPLTGKEYFHGFQELEMNQKVCGIYARFLGGFFKETCWQKLSEMFAHKWLIDYKYDEYYMYHVYCLAKWSYTGKEKK